MLLTGWVIFVFLAIAIVKYFYIRFIKSTPRRKEEELQQNATTVISSNESKPASVTEATSNGSARGAISSAKVVETLTGPKVIQSNRPQRPLRRRRFSRDSTNADFSFDTSSIIEDSIVAGTSSICSGPDNEVVEYVTKCHDWLFAGPQNRSWDEVKEAFVDAMNRSLRDIDKKVQTLQMLCNCIFIHDKSERCYSIVCMSNAF